MTPNKPRVFVVRTGGKVERPGELPPEALFPTFNPQSPSIVSGIPSVPSNCPTNEFEERSNALIRPSPKLPTRQVAGKRPERRRGDLQSPRRIERRAPGSHAT